MDKNLKELMGDLSEQLTMEFVKSKSYKKDEQLQNFKIVFSLMDSIIQLYDDVEVLKKENEELKKKIEKES